MDKVQLEALKNSHQMCRHVQKIIKQAPFKLGDSDWLDHANSLSWLRAVENEIQAQIQKLKKDSDELAETPVPAETASI